MKEQSWVPGMGVAFYECCQLYGARCGLESPCSWGRPLSLIFPRIGNKPAWYPCGLILGSKVISAGTKYKFYRFLLRPTDSAWAITGINSIFA